MEAALQGRRSKELEGGGWDGGEGGRGGFGGGSVVRRTGMRRSEVVEAKGDRPEVAKAFKW